LRAKVAVENLSDSLGVLAAWEGGPAVTTRSGVRRSARCRARLAILVPAELAQKVADLIARIWSTAPAYEAHRIASGVPRGGLDFMYGDAFPHETNMDRLHGVDFDKGCYGRTGGGVADAASARAHSDGKGHFEARRRNLSSCPPGDKPVGTWVRRQATMVSRDQVDRAADALAAGMPADIRWPCHPRCRPDDLLIDRSRPWHDEIGAPGSR